MRICFFSDTHKLHREIDLPDADMYVCAGDISSRGRENEIKDFMEWFSRIKSYLNPIKILILGNHDFLGEEEPSRFTVIDGIKIYGSPIQPTFHDWAFNVDRGDPIKKYWDAIPEDVDILITHGPPFGILDVTNRGNIHVGCEELIKRTNEIKPKIHVFGHIHEAYGVVERDGTMFINASVLNEYYEVKNKPLLVEFNNITKEVNLILD